MKTIIPLLTILLLASCTEVPLRIEEELKANCDCEKIERNPYVRNPDSLVVFDFYGCKNIDDFAESNRLMEILRQKVNGLCDMKAKLVFQFHVKEEGREIIRPHAYKRCMWQFMDF